MFGHDLFEDFLDFGLRHEDLGLTVNDRIADPAGVAAAARPPPRPRKPPATTRAIASETA